MSNDVSTPEPVVTLPPIPTTFERWDGHKWIPATLSSVGVGHIIRQPSVPDKEYRVTRSMYQTKYGLSCIDAQPFGKMPGDYTR